MVLIIVLLLELIRDTDFILFWCRDSAAWQNGELEKQIASIHDELRKSDYPWDHDNDLRKESARHKVYLDTIETLREQLSGLKDKIRAAKICGPGGLRGQVVPSTVTITVRT